MEPEHQVESENISYRERPRSRWIRKFQWMVALLLISLLLYMAGPSQMGATLRNADLAWLSATVIILLIFDLIGGFNVWILLSRLARIRLIQFLRVYFIAWATGLITPGKIGDASQVLFLKSQGISLDRSSASYIIDKVISLGILFLVASIGIANYLPEIKFWVIFTVPFTLAILVVTIIPLVLRFPDKPAILRRIRNLTRNSLNQIFSYKHHSGTILLNVVLTIIKWVILTLCYYCAFRSFSIALPLKAAAFIPIVSTLVGYIPVTAGGVGTVELTAVFLFGLEGIPKASVLSSYLLLRGIQYLTASILVLLIKHTDTQGHEQRTRKGNINP